MAGQHGCDFEPAARRRLSLSLSGPRSIIELNRIVARLAKFSRSEIRKLHRRGPVAIYVGIDWRVFGRHEAIRSCGEVNDLIVWFLGEGLPSVDLAHGDLS